MTNWRGCRPRPASKSLEQPVTELETGEAIAEAEEFADAFVTGKNLL